MKGSHCFLEHWHLRACVNRFLLLTPWTGARPTHTKGWAHTILPVKFTKYRLISRGKGS